MEQVDVMYPKTPYDLKPHTPHDTEIEQAVLGCAIDVEGGAAPLLGTLGPEDFFQPEHQAIFCAIRECADRGDGDVDAPTLKQYLQRHNLEAACGGIEYLYALRGHYAYRSDMPRQMQMMRRLRVRREMMEAARALNDRAREGAEPVLATLSSHRARLDELRELAVTDDDRLTASPSQLECEQGQVEWLWPDWVPRGQLTLLVAEPGVGKSALALHLTACAYGDRPWPDGAEPRGGSGPALYCDTEGNQRQLIDRIRAWQFPDEALAVWQQEQMLFDLQSDECLMRAERTVEKLGCPLMVVDTLRGGFDGDENSSEIGRMLSRWQEMARRTNVALLIVHHERKSQKGERGGGLNCVRGSSALTASPKAIIRLSNADRTEQRVRVEVIKQNYAPARPQLIMVQRDDGLRFAEEQGSAKPPLKAELAQELLLRELAGGSKPAKELAALAKREEISEGTLHRAANELKIAKTAVTLEDGTREYVWRPPAGVGPTDAPEETGDGPVEEEEEDPFAV